MSIASHLNHLFDTETCQAYTMRCAGKIGPCNAPDVRATTLGRVPVDLLYVPPLRHVTSCCINRLHPASRIGMPM